MPPLSCDVAASCGGCPLLGLLPSGARTTKLGELHARLREPLGAALDSIPIRWVGGDAERGYRHRIRLKIDDCGRIQFFNSQKSVRCAVLLPQLLETLGELLEVSQRHAGDFVGFAHLELRAPDLDGRPGLYLTQRDPCHKTSQLLQQRLLERLPEWLVSIGPSDSPPLRQRHSLLELYHYVPLSSFLQVNRAMNDQLVGDVVSRAKSSQVKTFCDLYAGAGNFTLPLLESGARGTAVEYEPHAMDACRDSAAAQNLLGGTFLRGDAAREARCLGESGETFDLVIVDPPRAGAKALLPHLAPLAPSAIVYLSCNPSSLGRDLKDLVALGYRVESIAAYEMFEHTRHLETCVWLSAQ